MGTTGNSTVTETVAYGHLWRTAFNKNLQNIRNGNRVAKNEQAALALIETEGFSKDELTIAQEGSKPLRKFNDALVRISVGELGLIEQAAALVKKHGLNQKELDSAIKQGVEEHFTTLVLYIGAGDLSYRKEAQKLIDKYGDTSRLNSGDDRKKSKVLEAAIEQGHRVAKERLDIERAQGLEWQRASI